MIFLFELALLAVLIGVVLNTDIHPGALACLYLIGWMTPWIIPQALSSSFTWQTLAIPTGAFLASWLLLWAVKKLAGHGAQWPVAVVGSLLVAALL